MNKTLGKLVSQRVTVAAILFLLLLFVIIPSIGFINFFTSKNDIHNGFSAIEIVIIFSWLAIILGWLVTSSYLAKNTNGTSNSTDFVTEYDDGIEVLADIYTLGQSKKIGLKNIKTIFACHAIFLALLILIVMVVSIIDIKLFNYIFDSQLTQLTIIVGYLAIILGGFKTIKRALK